MSNIALNPFILALFPLILLVFCFILLQLIDRKKATNNVEKIFIILFLTIVPGNVVPPFSYLNPSSLAIPSTALTSVTFIAQFLFYSFAIFLLRSKLAYVVIGIGNLLKNPFLSGLLLLTVLSGFWSETPFVTFKASFILLGYAVFASYITSRYNFQGIGKLLRLSGATITIVGTLAAILVPSIGRMDGVSWKGLMSHKNSFGFWMALTSALYLLEALDNPKHRWKSIGIAALSLFAMIPADSGTSKLMFLSMVGVVLVSKLITLLQRLKFRQAIVVSIFLGTLTSSLGVAVLTHKEAVLGAIGEDATLTGRTEFWPQVLHYISLKPILGYGYQGFWQTWRGYENPARTIINPNEFVPPNAHNGYLEIILATGFVGIAFFALAFVTTLISLLILTTKSKKGEAEIATIILIFSLLSSYAESNLWIINDCTFLFFIAATRLSVDATSRSVAKDVNFLQSSHPAS
jgi:exopolysaccharide production protein ExoQ